MFDKRKKKYINVECKIILLSSVLKKFKVINIRTRYFEFKNRIPYNWLNLFHVKINMVIILYTDNYIVIFMVKL